MNNKNQNKTTFVNSPTNVETNHKNNTLPSDETIKSILQKAISQDERVREVIQFRNLSKEFKNDSEHDHINSKEIASGTIGIEYTHNESHESIESSESIDSDFEYGIFCGLEDDQFVYNPLEVVYKETEYLS